MQFDKEKARSVIQRFGLSENTLNVWKTRGKIPSKYILPDGSLAEPDSQRAIDKHQKNKLMQILNGGKLNHNSLSAIKSDQIADFLRGKGNVSVAQYNELKKELVQLSNLLRALTMQTNYDKMLRAARAIKKETRFHWYLIFFQSTLDLIQKGYEPSVEQLEQMKIDAELFRQTLIL